MHTLLLAMTNLHTKFDVPSFTRSKNRLAAQKFKSGSLDTVQFRLRVAFATVYYCYEPQARLWLDMIIAQSDAHNFDAARCMLNSSTQIQRQRRSSRRPTPNIQL